MENLCSVCPRKCNVNRKLTIGYCKSNDEIKIAKVMMHYFEEPIISGEPVTYFNSNIKRGSGAIFFVGCNLGCVYCQNYDISGGGFTKNLNNTGKIVSANKLAEIFKKLEALGAYNINLVTPTHFTDQIVEALKIYKPNIPVIWNTSSYELPETLKKLEGLVDIYLADFKYFDSNIAKKYSFAADYPEICKNAILEMKRQQPNDIVENGLLKKGLIVRHLCLPNQTSDSKNILNWIKNNLGSNTIISLMSQYVPMGNAKAYSEINRKLKPIEYKILLSEAEKLNFENCYIQDLDSAEDCYTPNFADEKNIIDF